MKFSEDAFVDLLHRIAKDKKLLKEFLQDILTVNEYKNLMLRWRIIELLSNGMSHRDVADRLKIGIGTVTRGANELKNVSGGFAHVLKYELSKRAK